MKPLNSITALLFLAARFALNANQAAAEGYVHVTVGGAFYEDTTLDFSGVPAVSGVPLEDSVSVEIAGGGWFRITDFFDVGIQGGIGYNAPSIDLPPGPVDDVNFHLIPISIVGSIRIPLFKSDARPHGLIQPYVGVGPEFVLSTVELSAFGSSTTLIGFDVGYSVRAGVNLNLTDTLALFVEYKKTDVSSSLEEASNGGGGSLDVDFEADHISAGFGIHF